MRALLALVRLALLLAAVIAVVLAIIFGGRWAADYHARRSGLTDFWLVEAAPSDTHKVRIPGRPSRLCIRTYTARDARKWAARYWVASGIRESVAEAVAAAAVVRPRPIDRGGSNLPGYVYFNGFLDGPAEARWTDQNTGNSATFHFSSVLEE